MSQKPQQVTDRFLVEGAIYSLEQCGLLLRHAVNLYKARAYSSAIVLAAFAREELGRSRILRDLRKKVVKGGSVTIEDIREKCQDHVEKQKWAQLSTAQRTSGDQELAKLLKARLDNDPQSKEYQEADKQLNDITNRGKKRTLEDRHKRRMSALYVEPNDTGVSWSRPCVLSQEVARSFLVDAVSDYAEEYDRIQRGSIRYTDPDLANALEEVTDRPELPFPQWP